MAKNTEKDMARLGISNKDLDLPVQKLVESTRALSRVESAQILSRKFLQRDKVKQRMVENHNRFLDKVRKSEDFGIWRGSRRAPC